MIHQLERDQLERQIAELQSCVKERDAHIEGLENQISEMRSSLSWRLSMPLRALKKLLRLRSRLILKILGWAGQGILTLQLRKQLSFIGNYILIDQSGLFDRVFYLQSNPDVQSSGADPLEHYLSAGAREGRDPNPLFDTTFYMAQNPDVAAAGLNPLVHYLCSGASEGRDPSHLFETSLYSALNPDVVAKNINPLAHYLSKGKAEGRKAKLIDYLPQGEPVLLDRIKPKQNGVDIIIHAAKGFKEARACIESVFAARQSTPCEVIVINNKSPDQLISIFLENAALRHGFTLLNNQIKPDFHRSLKGAVQLNPTHDAILLAGDTVVANDWVDRLVRCAYANPRIGTVTPFSNIATIASYPRFCEDNVLPDGVSVRYLDSVFREVNVDKFVEIPVATGFCTYIRRDCLNEVALFEAQTSGAGSGVENDFCMKARSLGWRHALAADTFVYHAGSEDFSESSNLSRFLSMEIIRRQYSYHDSELKAQGQYDPAKPYRIAVSAQMIKDEGKPVILFVTHSGGGGVEKHIQDLMWRLAERANFLVLRPDKDRRWLLESINNKYPFDFLFDCRLERDNALKILKECGISRVHVHQVLGFTTEIKDFIYDLNVPYDFTAHDYLTLCPKIHMIDEGHRYCGEPDIASCNACISQIPDFNGQDITSWRSTHAWLINGAERVLAPSEDVANRLHRYYPDKNFIVVPHSDSLARSNWSDVQVRPLSGNGPMKILIIGSLGPHKGIDKVEAAAILAKQRDLPLEFHFLGRAYRELKIFPDSSLYEYGPYDERELLELISYMGPHIAWFPAQLPETYTYTLSACFAARLPVVAPDLGASPERLKGRPWSWIIEWDLPVENLIKFFMDIREENFLKSVAPEIKGEPLVLPTTFYETEYLNFSRADHK